VTRALTRTRLQAGVWEGVLTGVPQDAPPVLLVSHLTKPLSGVTVVPLAEGGWLVRVPVPAALINDGVQTFVIADDATGETLDTFAIIAGDALAEDIRVEVDLLRAELDMLKRAFRRHCVETA